GNTFTYDLDDEAGDDVLDDVPFDATGTTRAVAPGSYILTEDDTDDFNFVGWAAGDGTTCPDAPTGAETDIPVSITEGATTHICIYNEAADGGGATGTLLVEKVGVDDETFTFDIQGGETDIEFDDEGTTRQLAPGPYVITEDDAAGFVFSGWALAESGVCPATPQNPATETSIGVTITAGATTHLCIYNAAEETIVSPSQPIVVSPVAVSPVTLAPAPPDAGSGLQEAGERSINVMQLAAGVGVIL